jgi:hypothetical protein
MRPGDVKPKQWAKSRQSYWAATAQKSMSRAIAAFEKELGKPLPYSWKSFAHGCGPGELGGYFRLYVPSKGKDSVVNEHRLWFQSRMETSAGSAEENWLRGCVCFGWTIGGEALVWDTSKVIDPIRNEYEVVWTNRSDQKYKAFESFETFWIAALEQYQEYDDPTFPFRPF